MSFSSSLKDARAWRALAFAAGMAGPLLGMALPAQAQGTINILRDTEAEALLDSWEEPIARAAGLDPHTVKVYINNSPDVNAFVPGGQYIILNSAMVLYAKTPNELIGVMAHETGHIAGGHLSMTRTAISKASMPMLLSMALGLAAILAGAGPAGMAVMMEGQEIAQAQFTAFSRVQESVADQMGVRFLTAAHQSGRGMARVFERFANEDAMSSSRPPVYALDHPASRDRVNALQTLVESSPYKDVKDSDAQMHAFTMLQAKLAGFISDPNDVLRRWPVTDTSAPARYARAMAYMHKPDLPKAMTEIDSLIKDEPDNPYFQEVRGQIFVTMSKPELGVAPLQKAVDMNPTAPQLRIGLAAAQIATEKPELAQPAITNLKAALLIEDDDSFAWYEAAQAYNMMGNRPMADLATAENRYASGDFRQAVMFAQRARTGLAQGSPDWQRAADIQTAAAAEARNK